MWYFHGNGKASTIGFRLMYTTTKIPRTQPHNVLAHELDSRLFGLSWWARYDGAYVRKSMDGRVRKC
ncbi:uncharacterized protein EAE98_005029 [Botrytis deweyae]|uniref:Uncharacterized protein n=1 Tax=Botrytis deweyae TaxID=2478750 RepID=A0ABQ7IQ23_9HELO|nr:uncharacterized protein EAE98_005029 [Botrytis deweyae]KAF7930629.1 hypothetical protein EAE98_005029 [Botrytis deweyae]